MWDSKYYEDYLEHWGIPGMKWGVRRFQNEDGTLTPAGRARYGYDKARSDYKSAKKAYNKSYNKAASGSGIHLTKKGREADTKRWEDVYDRGQDLKKAKDALKASKRTYKEARKAERNADPNYQKAVKVAKAGAIVAGSALAVVGAVKLKQAWDLHQLGGRLINDYTVRTVMDELVPADWYKNLRHSDE